MGLISDQLMSSLKNALSKPPCAALLGSWSTCYEKLLKKLSVQVVKPGFQPRVEQMTAWMALIQRGSPYLAITQRYSQQGWVLAKPEFESLTISQQTTVVIHELRHQAVGGLGELGPKDPGARVVPT